MWKKERKHEPKQIKRASQRLHIQNQNQDGEEQHTRYIVKLRVAVASTLVALLMQLNLVT